MSDFTDVDVDDLLLEQPEEDPGDADEKALADNDDKMMREFGKDELISWPQPIRRRHLR